MNNISPKLRDVDKAQSIGTTDYFLVVINQKVYRIPSSFLLNMATGNGSPKGIALITTVPDANPNAGDWYWTGEDGDYPNFGVTGIVAGGRLIYNEGTWYYLDTSQLLFSLAETDPETVATPQAGDNYFGLFEGRSWVKDSDGNILYSDLITKAVNFDPIPSVDDWHQQQLAAGNPVENIGSYELQYVSFSSFGLSAYNKRYFSVTEGVVDLQDNIELFGHIIASKAIGDENTNTTISTDKTMRGKLIPINNASAITVTITDSLLIGDKIEFLQKGTGQITLVGDTGLTLLTAYTLKSRTQNSVITATKISDTEWLIGGDLATS